LLEWNGVDAWVEVASLGAYNIWGLKAFNGSLYGGASNGALYKWNNINAWIEVADSIGESIEYLEEYNDKLYASTSPNGKLLEWNGVDAWIEVAPKFDSVSYVFQIIEHNNELYGCTDTGQLLKWNGIDAWVEMAPQLGTDYVRSLISASILIEEDEDYCFVT